MPLVRIRLVYLNRQDVSQDQYVQHVDVRVLSDHIGLSMVLKMAMIPPICRSPLYIHKHTHTQFGTLLGKVIHLGCFRQVCFNIHQ